MLKVYKPVFKCIYCAKNYGSPSDATADGPKEIFGKEHIIPLSLKGEYLLPRASCKRHEKITGNYEEEVTRVMYGNYRTAKGFPTRNEATKRWRKNGQVSFSAEDFEGRKFDKWVYASEMPADHIAISLPVPELLLGTEPTLGTLGCEFKAVTDEKQADALLKKYNLKNGDFDIFMNEKIFMRLLAKIGHAFIAAEVGINRFNPTLLDVIEGTSMHLKKFIGGFGDDRPQANEALAMRTVQLSGTSYIVVDISLKSMPHIRPFQVIAGTVL